MLDDVIEPLFSTENGHRLGWIVGILAGILLLSAVVNAVTMWYTDVTLGQETSVMGAQKAPVLPPTSQLVNQLPAQHVFGELATEDASGLPITSLQLHLMGITKASQDNFSKAIISEGGRRAKVYSIGDEVTSGIKIYSINIDNVVLERGGRLEKLPLARPPLLFQDKPKSLWQEQSRGE
jgi:type II secretory pathway component PulC